nr:neurogenin-1 [Hydra vulgaris]
MDPKNRGTNEENIPSRVKRIIDADEENIPSRVKRIIDTNGRKRRIYSIIHQDPKQSCRRFRANDRERHRMNSLNGALQTLKRCVPLYHGKRRVTKLQILQFACHYISDLSDILCNPNSLHDSFEDNRNSQISSLINMMEIRSSEGFSATSNQSLIERMDFLTCNTINMFSDVSMFPSSHIYPIVNIPQCTVSNNFFEM